MKMMLAIAVFCGAVAAQLPEGGWITNEPYMSALHWDNQWGWTGTVFGTPGGVTVDEHGVLFTTSPFDLYRWDYQAGVGFTGNLLMSSNLGGSSTFRPGGYSLVGCSEALRDGIWMLNWMDLVRANKTGSTQNPPVLMNVAAAVGVPLIRSACCDGREIFFHVPPTSLFGDRICALDIRRTPMTIRTVVALGADAGKLLMIRNGDILFGSFPNLQRLDPVTGTIAPSGVAWPPGSVTGVTIFGYDPWSDVLCATNHWDHFIATRQFAGGAWMTVGTIDAAHEVVTTSARPFELFGIGCNNGLARDPRMRWQGLPLQGQSFTLTLHGGEPGIAFFWVGVSDTSSAFGVLRFDGGVFGAPGCRVLASIEATWLTNVDSAGRAAVSVPLPINPSLVGLEAFAQTASTSTANSLGLATSDALVIRVR